MQERRKEIEYFIRALEFFKEKDEAGIEALYYVDIPRDLLDIFISNIAITFDRDINFRAARSKGVDQVIKFLEELRTLTYDKTVTVLEFTPQEKVERQKVEKAIRISVEHEAKVGAIKKEVVDPNVTILIEALAEPEKLEQDLLKQVPENTPDREAIVRNYVNQIAAANSPKDIPVFDTKTITLATEPIVSSGFWSSPISAPIRTVITGGIEKIGKEDQVTATAMILPHYGHSTPKEVYELRDRARALGVNEDSLRIVEKTIIPQMEILKKGSPDWLKLAIIGRKANLTNEQVTTLFSGRQVNYQAIAPSTSLLGSVFQRITSRFTGNFMERSIRRNLINKTAKAAGEGVTKKVGGRIFGTVFKNVGSAIRTPLFGLVINARTGLIRNFGRAIAFGGVGVILGGLVGGPIGAIVGGLLGASGDWKKWGKRILAIAAVLFTAFIGAVLTPLLIVLVGIPIMIAFILFIINAGAYVVPPGPPIGANGSNGSTGTGPGGGVGFPVHCATGQSPIPFGNNSGSAIAQRGYGIVADLYQGFWCDWNRSPGGLPSDIINYPPSYPQLFNLTLFQEKPNPTLNEMQSCPTCLFWCAWLISKAYSDAGYSMVQAAGVVAIRDYYQGQGRFIAPNVASGNISSPNYIPPGSAVFMRTSSFTWGHVALVYSVSQDGFTFVQSNAGTKNGSFSFNQNGVGVQNPNIMGFGTP